MAAIFGQLVQFMAVWWLIFALAAVAALVAHVFAARSFRASAEKLIKTLESAAYRPYGPVVLPALIEAYVACAAARSAAATVIRMQQRGAMRLRVGGEWRPMSAIQVTSVGATDFVSFADVEVLPLVFVRVLDAHVGGRGILEVRLFGSVPIVRRSGAEIDRSELQRYLAELAWVPQAMKHNTALRWSVRDENVIEVSAGNGAASASVNLIFEFGELSRAEAADRPRIVGGHTVPCRWLGHFFDYAQREAGYLPRRAEASWLLPDGPFAYWRGEVTEYAVDALTGPTAPPRLRD